MKRLLIISLGCRIVICKLISHFIRKFPTLEFCLSDGFPCHYNALSFLIRPSGSSSFTSPFAANPEKNLITKVLSLINCNKTNTEKIPANPPFMHRLAALGKHYLFMTHKKMKKENKVSSGTFRRQSQFYINFVLSVRGEVGPLFSRIWLARIFSVINNSRAGQPTIVGAEARSGADTG